MKAFATDGGAARVVVGARGLRGFGDGLLSLLLPVWLAQRGFGAAELGAIATATLLGSSAMTLLAGFAGRALGPRGALLAAAVLMAATGLAFVLAEGLWPLLVVAFLGTLNPSAGEASVFLPLEQARLSEAAEGRERTTLFARYSLVGALAAAGGALAAALPELATARLGVSFSTALDACFLFYGGLGVVLFVVYLGLPAAPQRAGAAVAAPLRRSRRFVLTLSALFALDSFAGGLVLQSLLALWLLQRFELSLAAAAQIFFWTGVLSAFSYPLAARLAGRFGLVNTMVFSHLPANVCLVLVAFAPSLGVALALLLARAGLSQMDVPTRTAYVMAIVPPEERAAAASVTAVSRSLAQALSPALAGAMLAASPFGWPLVIGGALKIAYDLALLAQFGKVRPPHEAPP
jgi:MFS family permease